MSSPRLLGSTFCALRSAFILLLAACATTVPTPSARFKILQVNDVYKIEGLEGGQSGGLARVRTLRTLLGSDGTPVLLLHAGDALYPSVMSKYLDAKPMVDVLNRLDGNPAQFDQSFIITFGNHEFDKSDPTILLERLKDSQFGWVSTNSDYCNPECTSGSNFPGVPDVMVRDVGGVKIGFIGLMYPFQNKYQRTTDVVAAARDAVTALREKEGVRVVIAITHEDMPDDVKLLQAVPGINLIVGGHDHLYQQQRVGSAWVAKADADAKSVIVWDVYVPPSGPVQTTPLRMVLDSTVPKDPDVDATVQKWMAALSEKLGGNDTLGQTENLLEGVEPAVRGRETALGNLLADVLREQMQTDVAVLNGGSIRINDNIPPGPITKYDMEGVFYYTSKMVATTVTGQQLLDMLNNSVSRVDAGDGRFLQVSGFKFQYHPQNGGYVVNAADVQIGGRPLDVNARYTIGLIDFMYTRGTEDGYTLFADSTRPPKVNTDREADLRTMVESYIKRVGTVTTDIEGRIVRAK
ncbi:MAG TPA: bifunctional UDP-sugar hydrolase/5'-nucleotidase [Thermoanaerobaculia bacterium]|nr:bifunctional UDP-sugar hydrolase/5'-nucleotidase [Thermoanaerobaculia bacterium]